MMKIFEGYENITFSHDDDVLFVTLNRPEKLNAVNNDLHHELVRAFAEVDYDEASRVVVLTGAGRAFCAGGDVGRMKESGNPIEERPATVRASGSKLVYNLLSIEKPVVAMINGPAVGLGATIALMSDVSIMAEEASIGDPHVTVGLVAGDGGAVIWPLLIGVQRAKEFLMTGRMLTGREAAAIGLVNRAVPAQELYNETMTLARKLASMAPYAVRATKSAINRLVWNSANIALDIGLAWETLSMGTEDFREGVTAFLEKRPGKFTGK